MRTGIITLSAAENYGAILQASSLCRFLNDNYCETEIINFVPNFMCGRYQLIRLDRSTTKNYVKSLIYGIAHFPIRILKKYRFKRYCIKYCKFSTRKYIREFKEDCYDQYIVGSDQVFNLELTDNDYNFFLPHVADRKKVASYAASIGMNSITEEHKKIYINYLKDFTFLSLRESTAVKMISNLMPAKHIHHNLDSVFLHDGKYWKKVAARRIVKDKYILIYTFKNFDLAYDIANGIGNNYIKICISDELIKKRSDVRNIKAVGPREFLSLINYAEYVITDSFHGTAFSIIFKKQFMAIPYEGTSSRIEDLLEYFDLEDHLYRNDILLETGPFLEEKYKQALRDATDYFNIVYNRDAEIFQQNLGKYENE